MAAAATKPNAVAEAQERRFRANDVFDKRNKILFQDDFRSGGFGKWNLSKDYRYGIQKENPQEDEGRGSPWPGGRKKAVRFCVDRGPNAFRSEISLPSEKRFNERWYGARIYVPKEWVFDPSRGNDIVIQWHGIPGNWRATFPSQAIYIGDKNWFIRQSFGSAQTKPTRTNLKLEDPVEPGKWVSWIIHAKWESNENGLLQIWKDGKLVLDRKGPNVYSDKIVSPRRCPDCRNKNNTWIRE